MIQSPPPPKSFGLAVMATSLLALSATAQSVSFEVNPSTPTTINDALVEVRFTPGTNPGDVAGPGSRLLVIPTLVVDPNVSPGGLVSPSMATTASAANPIAFPQYIIPNLTQSQVQGILDNHGTADTLNWSPTNTGFPISTQVLEMYLDPLEGNPGNMAALANHTIKLDGPDASGDWTAVWDPSKIVSTSPLMWNLAVGSGQGEIDVNDLARLLAAQTGGDPQSPAVARQNAVIEDLIAQSVKKLVNLVIKFVAVVINSDNGDYRLVATQPTSIQDLLPVDVPPIVAPFEPTSLPLYRLTTLDGAWFYPVAEDEPMIVEVPGLPDSEPPSVSYGAFFMNQDNTAWVYSPASLTGGVGVPCLSIDSPPPFGWAGNYSVYRTDPEGTEWLDLATNGTPLHPHIGQYLVIELN